MTKQFCFKKEQKEKIYTIKGAYSYIPIKTLQKYYKQKKMFELSNSVNGAYHYHWIKAEDANL